MNALTLYLTASKRKVNSVRVKMNFTDRLNEQPVRLVWPAWISLSEAGPDSKHLTLGFAICSSNVFMPHPLQLRFRLVSAPDCGILWLCPWFALPAFSDKWWHFLVSALWVIGLTYCLWEQDSSECSPSLWYCFWTRVKWWLEHCEVLRGAELLCRLTQDLHEC